MATRTTVAPLDYADVRIAEDGAVLIAVGDAGFNGQKPIIIKRAKNSIYILQSGRLRVKFALPIPKVLEQICEAEELLVAQVTEAGEIQVFDKIIFK